MVDVSGKSIINRRAEASGSIYMLPETLKLIRQNLIKKGDVLATAKIAAIMGAKKTSELIPLCHNIPIDQIDVDFKFEKDRIDINSIAICSAKTGIEMEAITAVSIAAITIYDMCKAVDQTMTISNIRLVKKTKDEISG